MMKFFRKHMKKLLMIFMSLLLVAWLGGTALTALLSPNPRSAVEATSRYGEICTGDRAQADRVTAILDHLRLPWSRPAHFFRIEQAEPLTLYDWVLLVREAEQMGFTVSQEEAREFLFNIWRKTLNDVYQVARGLDIAPEEVYAAAGEFVSVTEAIATVFGAAQVSEAEVRLAARNVYERVKVHLVALKAEAFVDADAALAEAELEELFTKYREQERGKAMTFGYFLPPRVKAQYLKVDLEKVTAGLRRSEKALEREARRYWKENREKDPAFKRPPPEEEEKADSPEDAKVKPDEDAESKPDGQAEEKPDEDAEPKPDGENEARPDKDADSPNATSQPAEPSSPYLTWAEARPAAIEAVRKLYAAERTVKIADYLAGRLAERWDEVERGEDGYQKLPPGVDDLNHYETVIAEQPPALYYEGAVTAATTDWFTPDEVGSVPGLGGARLEISGSGPQPFTRLAFQVQGLVDLPRSSEVDASLFLARCQSCPVPLKDGEGNLYVYRIIEVEPARAPGNLDEVREEVESDLRLQSAYQEAQLRAEALLARAKEGSLKDAWEADEELQETLGDSGGGFTDAAPFSRERLQKYTGGFSMPPYVQGLGFVDQAFVTRCFEQGASDEENDRWAVIPLPDQATVAVVERQELQPVRQDSYARGRQQLVSGLEGARQWQVISEWLNPELIRSRNHFAPAQRRR